MGKRSWGVENLGWDHMVPWGGPKPALAWGGGGPPGLLPGVELGSEQSGVGTRVLTASHRLWRSWASPMDRALAAS